MLQPKPKILIVGYDRNLYRFAKENKDVDWLYNGNAEPNPADLNGVFIKIDSEKDLSSVRAIIKKYRRVPVVGILEKRLSSMKGELLRAGLSTIEEKPIDSVKLNQLLFLINWGYGKKVSKERSLDYFMKDICLLAMNSKEQSTLLNKASEMLLRIFNADRISIMLFDAGGKVLEVKSAFGIPNTIIKYSRRRLGEKIAGWVAERMEPVIIHNGLESDSRFRGMGSRERIKSALVFPLVYGKRLLGVINITRLRGSNFNEDELNTGILYATNLAILLIHVRSLEDIELLSAAMHKSSDGIISLDAEGRILMINKKARQLLGMGDENQFGRFLPEQVFSAIKQVHYRKILEGKEIVNLQINYPRPDGSTKVLSLASTPIFEKDKGLSKTILTIRDLTPVIMAQREMMKLDKVTTFVNWVNEIAHQMNNPLSVIFGNISVLENYLNRLVEICEAQSEKTECISEIEKIRNEAQEIIHESNSARDRINNFIKALQGFNLREDEPSEECFVTDLLNRAIYLLDIENFSHIKILREYRKSPRVVCFRERLINALFNILLNAVEACGGEGEVKVIVDEHDEYALVEISDSGLGMGTEQKQRLFEPFYTTKKSPLSVGLGLAYVYAVTNMHSGRVWIESKENKGTKVSLEIPLVSKRE